MAARSLAASGARSVSKVSADKGGCCQNDVVRVIGVAIAEGELIASVGCSQEMGVMAVTPVLRSNVACQFAGNKASTNSCTPPRKEMKAESGFALGWSGQRWAAGLIAAARQHAADQAAMLLFDFAEAGKSRQEALLFGFGVVDARE